MTKKMHTEQNVPAFPAHPAYRQAGGRQARVPEDTSSTLRRARGAELKMTLLRKPQPKTNQRHESGNIIFSGIKNLQHKNADSVNNCGEENSFGGIVTMRVNIKSKKHRIRQQ